MPPRSDLTRTSNDEILPPTAISYSKQTSDYRSTDRGDRNARDLCDDPTVVRNGCNKQEASTKSVTGGGGRP